MHGRYGADLVAARGDELVEITGSFWFEPQIAEVHSVAAAEGEVVSVAVDERKVLWATRDGSIRRATLRPEPR